MSWLIHCDPSSVVWCVLDDNKCGMVESLWCYTCGVCYRPASVSWSSHCGPTRVVWCVLQASKCGVVESLWSYTCGVVCVTGQQVCHG